VARSTLADANESRDWRIYADFAQVLIAIARPLYASDPIDVDLDQSLYALDSTTIDLCLSPSRHDRQIGPMLGPLRTYGHCKGEMVASFGACKERVT
jgi:hypothetical protein